MGLFTNPWAIFGCKEIAKLVFVPFFSCEEEGKSKKG